MPIKFYFFCILLFFPVLAYLTIGVCEDRYTSANVVYFVSVNGSDNDIGNLERPFQTLAKAIASLPKGEMKKTIYLREGIYFLNDSLMLNEVNNLEISNYQNETVKLLGGRHLPSSRFKKLSWVVDFRNLAKAAKGYIYTLNLRESGILDYGELVKTGFGTDKSVSPLELFENNKVLTVARWPNIEMLAIDSVLQKELKKNKVYSIFSYAGEQRNWKNKDDIWVSGMFSVGWASDNLPVSISESEGDKVEVAAQDFSSYGIFSKEDASTGVIKSASKVRGFYFYNILEELDEPGEWYLDRDTGDLYVWPLSNINEAIFEVTVNKTQNVFQLNSCRNIRISGLSFSLFRGSVLKITNSEAISVFQSEFLNVGVSAISVSNSRNVEINDVRIYGTGSTAIFLSGGDRKALEPAHNKVTNSDISNFGHRYLSYSPAVSLDGVGNTISNSYLHESTNQAIIFQGNDHLIENNHIKATATGFNDIGAIYTGRDLSSTGTTIENNLFESIGNEPGKAAAAIYFDDGSGGFTVSNNIFWKCGNGSNNFGAVHVNGGGDNLFLNNIFVDTYRAFSNSFWSAEKWKSVYFDNKANWNKLYKVVDISSQTYIDKYPWLKGFGDWDNVPDRLNTVKGLITFNTPPINRVGKDFYFGDTFIIPSDTKMDSIEAIYNLLPQTLLKSLDFKRVNFENFTN